MSDPFLMLIAFGARMVAPDLTRSLLPDDYPVWAMQSEASAAVRVELLIEPNGKISRCLASEITGSRMLGQQICPILRTKRAVPARDPNGLRVHGVFDGMEKFYLPETIEGSAIQSLQETPDVTLSVKQLPNGKSRAEAKVNLLVDERGKVVLCEGASHSLCGPLIAAACSAADTLGSKQVHDARGNPVRYVTNKKVLFLVR